MLNIADTLGQKQWSIILRRLLNGLPSNNAMMTALRSCDGPGVLLADLMFKAELWWQKQKKHNKKGDYVVEYLSSVVNPFSEFDYEVEFDLRGSIHTAKPHITITVGEIKSSLNELSSAKKQVAARCRLLLFAAKAIFPSQFKSIIMIGRILIPRQKGDSDRPSHVDEAGVSYYVHLV